MKTSEELKQLVKEKYTEIALQSKEQNAASCCGSGCCSTEVYNIMTDNYTNLTGYLPEADLSLGCGLPTEHAYMKPGDTVLDLGSGAGNDCFVARAVVGETGKVIGVDMTEAMIDKARANAETAGFNNVEFRLGDIENLPVGGERVNVVVSNCVLNLVPNKEKAFQEIYRVLKPGGHFSVADVVLVGELPEPILQASEFYVGCVAGAIQKQAYLDIIKAAGFTNLIVQKEKPIVVPDDILSNYLSPEAIKAHRESGAGIYSVTVYAEKPSAEACCAPGCCN